MKAPNEVGPEGKGEPSKHPKVLKSHPHNLVKLTVTSNSDEDDL